MRITISLFLILVCMGASAQAQSTAADSVKLAIGRFFSAMRDANSNNLLNCFTDSAILETVAKDGKGETLVKRDKLADFAKIVSNLPKGAADERITFDVVKVDGSLAIAWTPYRFYFNGQFSHCGVNSFQLVRVQNQWRIQYVIDTRRKDGCE
ncbi:MAG: hypothetical protein V4450_02730 [Bacteroidota bacterium]